MGNTPSAGVAVGEQIADLNRLMELLKTKLTLLEGDLDQVRGENSLSGEKEVAGGRTALRMSRIRVASGEQGGFAKQLGDGIEDFFNAASSSIAGEEGSAQLSALEGTKKLLTGGLEALFGVQSGAASEQRSFVVLYLNNAFVRVDYYIYAYNAEASTFGGTAFESGVCYVADLAVLGYEDLEPHEIDYFATQALAIPNGDFDKLVEIKLQFQILRNLNQRLDDKEDEMTLEQLQEVIEQVKSCYDKLAATFKEVDDGLVALKNQ